MDYTNRHDRVDQITGRLAIFRPNKPIMPLILKLRQILERIDEPPNHIEGCFYCQDHSSLTNSAISAISTSAGIVCVTTKRDLDLVVTEPPTREADGINDCISAYGVDETLILGYEHSKRLTTIPAILLATGLNMLRSRLIDLRKDPYLKNLMFSVDGNNMADGLQGHYVHPSFHLDGITELFPRISEAMLFSSRHCQRKDRCLFCDIIRDEIKNGSRVVEQTKHFLVYEPYASRHPFETIIIPLDHAAYYEYALSESTEGYEYWLELASLIQRTLTKLEQIIHPRFPYSLSLQNAPLVYRPASENGTSIDQIFHHSIRIRPYLDTRPPRREDIRGIPINPLLPEKAAEYLRMSPEELTSHFSN